MGCKESLAKSEVNIMKCKEEHTLRRGTHED